jgi:hypothetical protein
VGNAIFPTLPGLAWSVLKTPQWSTAVQKAVSGREVRRANQSRPIWKFSLTYEVLRGASAYNEYQQLLAFYNARQGAFDSFLFSDSSDNTVTNQAFGTGDGLTAVFPLTHPIGAWSEPVGYAPSPTVSVGGVLQYGTPRTNLLTYNRQFSNGSWSAFQCTAVAAPGVVGPDGSSNVFKQVPNSGVTSSEFSLKNGSGPIVSGATYTASIRVKPAELTKYKIWLSSFITTSGGQAAFFDLITGKVISVSSGITASIKAIANGFFLLTVTFTATASSVTNTVFFDASGGSTLTGDGTTGVYIFGSQVEPGSVATPEIMTGSAPVTVTDYSSDGVNITFASPPPNGSSLTWSGQFYYRVRFDKDTMEFEQFMQDFWLLKKCDLTGVI